MRTGTGIAIASVMLVVAVLAWQLPHEVLIAIKSAGSAVFVLMLILIFGLSAG